MPFDTPPANAGAGGPTRPAATAWPDAGPTTALDHASVERAYARIAHLYDFLFGLALHHGRARAVARMAPTAGMRVLEVGVGTGLNAPLYPAGVRVVGIDLSASMLRRAHARLRERFHERARGRPSARRGAGPWAGSWAGPGAVSGAGPSIALCRTDATALPFPADTFDIVYAPYVMNCVPDAIAVAREMQRVTRAGGRVVFLNHFRSPRAAMRPVERMVTGVTRHFGFTWDLDLDWLLTGSALTPSLVEGVNVPKFSKLVICRVP